MKVTPEQFRLSHRVFGRRELLSAMSEESERRQSGTESTLHKWLRRGSVFAVKRGVFVRGGIDLDSSDHWAIGCRMAPDATLAYGTALAVHGFSQVLFEDVVFATWTKVRPLEFDGRRFLPVRPRAELQGATDHGSWSTTLDRGPHELRVTSRERTVVDVLDRPDLAAGSSEVWRALSAIPHLEFEELLDYTRLLARATVAAKLGVLLERRRAELDVPERVLSELERLVPRKPFYWKRGVRGRFERRWNAIVPEALFSDDGWGEG